MLQSIEYIILPVYRLELTDKANLNDLDCPTPVDGMPPEMDSSSSGQSPSDSSSPLFPHSSEKSSTSKSPSSTGSDSLAHTVALSPILCYDLEPRHNTICQLVFAKLLRWLLACVCLSF